MTTLPFDDPRHGTQNAYGNLKCRCPECRLAHAEYQRDLQRAWRAKRMAWGLNVRGSFTQRPEVTAAALARYESSQKS